MKLARRTDLMHVSPRALYYHLQEPVVDASDHLCHVVDADPHLYAATRYHISLPQLLDMTFESQSHHSPIEATAELRSATPRNLYHNWPNRPTQDVLIHILDNNLKHLIAHHYLTHFLPLKVMQLKRTVTWMPSDLTAQRVTSTPCSDMSWLLRISCTMMPCS